MSEKGSPHSVSGREIPNRRIADISNIPSDFSTTPGGSIFSTTPGGTRLFYDRAFLMQCRDSPLARTPPINLPNIPGVTSPRQDIPKENSKRQTKADKAGKATDDHPQFEMDI